MASDEQNGLRKYIPRKQTVVLRPPNPGKTITDNLPTIEIDPETLDQFSEVQPLSELIGVMSDKVALVARVEMPKWRRRGKVIEYGWGAFKSVLRMDFAQQFVKNKTADRGTNAKPALTELKKEIREYAASRGYICGFTKIDRRFIAGARDDKFPYDTAVVLGMEMDAELLNQVPHPGERLFDFEVYVESGKRVFDVADFIRSRGVRCWARAPFDGWIKYPPHAINAGLGELGANGVVITKEFGPRLRWTMISVDADLEPDAPVNLNMAAYCDACRLCIKACPGKAIPEERIWWRGVLKRKINDTKCWPWFVKYEGCGICLKICPIHRFGYKNCMEAYGIDKSILGKNRKDKGTD